ncbi:FAD-dependent oxidoreductase [Infirmifilum uzonense]|uniref:FAD-dependent oxidoreductase n=1 Tax=Infirmifilum TaxID=2856573 RepID=UPI003C745B08
MATKRYDVVIVGGGAGGLATALALKTLRSDLKVLVIRRTKSQPVPCSVPYIVETIGSLEGCLIPDSILTSSGAELLIDEVVKINPEEKFVLTSSGRKINYDKLVLSMGTSPAKLNIPGIGLKGVVLISKEGEPLAQALEVLKNAKRIVIIGAGFVGMEYADDLAKGREIHVVEVLDEALALSFDKEFGEIARKNLEAKGVKFHLKTGVKEILGNGKVEKVLLSNGDQLDADAVLIGVGVTPNTEIAREAGIELDEQGHVIVDSFMRTNIPDIYAVGDIAQKRDFFTGKPIRAYFATLAVFEGRVAAMHIAGVNPSKGCEGILPVFSTTIAGTALTAAGLTESAAEKLGLKVIAVTVEALNRHPASLPGVYKIKFKALFSKGDLRLVGVQIAGPESVGEMINYAAAAIQSNLTAYDIVKLQYATHPLLTASPIVYPLHMAALSAISQK